MGWKTGYGGEEEVWLSITIEHFVNDAVYVLYYIIHQTQSKARPEA